MLPQTLLTIADAARKLGVTTKTLRRWEKRGLIAPVRTVGNQRRYSLEQINALLTTNDPDGIDHSPLPIDHHPRIHTHSVRYLSAGLAAAVAGLLVGSGIYAYRLWKQPDTSGEFAPGSADIHEVLGTSSMVLGAEDQQLTVNIPSIFEGDTSFNGVVTLAHPLKAPNVLYSLTAGDGISITAGQNPTISNSGILSLTAGDGITVDGNKITNSGIRSLAAGTGISIDGNKITNTSSPDYTQSGWTDSGSSISLTTLTDSVTVGALTTGAITATSLTTDGITITNGNSILPDTDLGG